MAALARFEATVFEDCSEHVYKGFVVADEYSFAKAAEKLEEYFDDIVSISNIKFLNTDYSNVIFVDTYENLNALTDLNGG